MGRRNGADPIHLDEPVLRIPSVSPAPIAGQVAVKVIGECFRAVGEERVSTGGGDYVLAAVMGYAERFQSEPKRAGGADIVPRQIAVEIIAMTPSCGVVVV